MIKTMVTIVITLIANNGSRSIIIIINIIKKRFYPNRQFLIYHCYSVSFFNNVLKFDIAIFSMIVNTVNFIIVLLLLSNKLF